jgi:hypothetical protein
VLTSPSLECSITQIEVPHIPPRIFILNSCFFRLQYPQKLELFSKRIHIRRWLERIEELQNPIERIQAKTNTIIIASKIHDNIHTKYSRRSRVILHLDPKFVRGMKVYIVSPAWSPSSFGTNLIRFITLKEL